MSATLGLSFDDQIASLDPADMAYIACATIGISVITPGIALFYGGSLKSKSFLTLCIQSYLITALITAQWYFFGFSFASSIKSSSVIIGDFSLAALINLNGGPLSEGATIPAIETFVFSAFFAICTVQIFVGAIAERGRLCPSLVLGFIWCTIVYSPFAYWTWAPNGWLLNLGSLDFAGGGPVHIASGVASLAYSWYIGKRKEWKDTGKFPEYKPHSPLMTFLGSLLIYFPWLFFNSGTMATIQTPRTLYILANTQLAASFGLATFTIMDYLITKKWSIKSAAEGLIVGLVFVTPACGFLAPWAIVVGTFFTAIICRACYDFPAWTGIDDATNSFVIHGIGGICGSIFVGLFASPNIASLDGVTDIEGGWIFHHWKQMGYQFAGSCSIIGWTFLITYALCFIVDHIPGLKLRVSEEIEEMGLDYYEMAEVAYPFLEKNGMPGFGNRRISYDGLSIDGQNVNSSSSNGEETEINFGSDVKRPVEVA